jgi:hypothetical protein
LSWEEVRFDVPDVAIKSVSLNDYNRSVSLQAQAVKGLPKGHMTVMATMGNYTIRLAEFHGKETLTKDANINQSSSPALRCKRMRTHRRANRKAVLIGPSTQAQMRT